MSVSVVQKLQCRIKDHFAVPVADWQKGRTDVRPHYCEHLCADELVNWDFPLTPLAACPDKEFDQNVQALFSVKLLLSGWTLLFSHRSHKSQTDSEATSLISNSAVWGLGAWLASVFHAFFHTRMSKMSWSPQNFPPPEMLEVKWPWMVALPLCSSFDVGISVKVEMDSYPVRRVAMVTKTPLTLRNGLLCCLWPVDVM